MLNAIVDSVIRVPASGMPPKALALIHRALTFPNPEYVKRVRFDRWTGATPEEICLVRESRQGHIILPRGAVEMLRDALAKTGELVRFEDRRLVGDSSNFPFRLELRNYQADAVAVMVAGTQGCAVLPCGSGKTIIGVGIISKTGQPTLILVHTKDLLGQWTETVRTVLGVEPGVVAEGVFDPQRITIAMVQSLATLDGKELRELGRRFGLLIADEGHHLPAVSYQRLLPFFPAKYRFALTATPDRSDGLTPLMLLGIGPILVTVGHQQLVDGGHLVLPEIRTVETGCNPDAATYAKMVSLLVTDPERNRLIMDLACRHAAAGHTTLVLSNRVIHCRQLAKSISDQGTPAEALTGSVGKQKRKDTLRRFREGSVKVLCATSLADEGLDIERLSRLILATPARAEGRTIQRLGRLMRPHPGKGMPVLYDLVDDHPMARRQHSARRRAYRKVLGADCMTRRPGPRLPLQGVA
jgi:superfamily II DNA or RNA helicase